MMCVITYRLECRYDTHAVVSLSSSTSTHFPSHSEVELGTSTHFPSHSEVELGTSTHFPSHSEVELGNNVTHIYIYTVRSVHDSLSILQTIVDDGVTKCFSTEGNNLCVNTILPVALIITIIMTVSALPIP